MQKYPKPQAANLFLNQLSFILKNVSPFLPHSKEMGTFLRRLWY